MEKIRRTEFWLATAIYLLIILVMIFPLLSEDGTAGSGRLAFLFEENDMQFDHFSHYLMPKLVITTVSYVTFVGLNNAVVPYFLERKQQVFWGVVLGILSLAIFWGTLKFAFTWQLGYMIGYRTLDEFYTLCGLRAFIITFTSALIFVVYYLVKVIYLRHVHPWVAEKKVWKIIPPDITVMVIVWLLAILLMLADDRPARALLALWVGGAYILAYVGYYYYFFKPLLAQRQQLKRLLPTLIVIWGVTSFVGVVGFDFSTDIRRMVSIRLLVPLLNAIIIIPLAWWISTIRLSRRNEVLNLEKALGRSSANLDFLRAQINPHFLFNALNTLYGTALQEEAPRTSEGVQRLGDMMRFMLHENHQEKIELDKEIAYLQNYIALQRLRTQSSPDIKIEVNINEQFCEHEIAPMILIPFVENAFKHGISLRNRSWIVVSLSCDKGHIYFDAYNSVHVKPDNDPEKYSLGIGLNNVKHRLHLLYPDRHELSIRETGSEFFVHLTIRTV